jgi:hypothetical protein
MNTYYRKGFLGSSARLKINDEISPINATHFLNAKRIELSEQHVSEI